MRFSPTYCILLTALARLVSPREALEVSGLLLESGETRAVSLELPVQTLGFARGQVQAEGRCRIRPDEATTVAQLWDEVRKALAVQQ